MSQEDGCGIGAARLLAPSLERARHGGKDRIDDDDVEEKDDRSEGCEMGGRGMLFAVLCLSSLTLAEPLGSLAD